MKMTFLALLASLLLPFAADASAVKMCRVRAVVEEIVESGEKPVLRIKAKTAEFESGHSMGEDCSDLLQFGPVHLVKLDRAVKNPVGSEILLLFVDVRNMTQSGPRMHQHWEVHKNNREP